MTRDQLTVRQLPPSDVIETALRALRNALSDPAAAAAHDKTREQYATDVTNAASALLVDPIAGQLGKRKLLVVADGILNVVPFAALTWRDPSSPETPPAPLLTTHVVVASAVRIDAGLDPPGLET